MIAHECDVCRGGAVYKPGGVILRTDADIAAYLVCCNARWPNVYLRIVGLARQMERMADAL